MSNISYQRVQRDFKEFVKDDEAMANGIKVTLVNDDLYKLRGEVIGPSETPYAGGKFLLDVNIPATYPFHPPKISFVTKIWHPNVSSVTGAICLDILKDQWAASMTLRTVFLSIQALLCSPEPSDPQDAVVANQCSSQPTVFWDTARFWSQHYASAPGPKEPTYSAKVSQLMEMGVSEEKALVALSGSSWNVALATESLFS